MMKLKALLFCLLLSNLVFSQLSQSLNGSWVFRQSGTVNWHTAAVPGTVHTDLLANRMIPDPFYRDNESKVQWVETKGWEYQKTFAVPADLLKKKNLKLVFDGIDTDAEIYLNGKSLLTADNMFRQWTIDVSDILKQKNVLRIVFAPPSQRAKEAKAAEAIPHPENERIYIRKAQYQFGWDWGPRLVTCGIWKDVRLESEDISRENNFVAQNDINLVRQKDANGESFYFTVKGKPTYIKGSNWIPADSFLPRAKKKRVYEQLIKAAKEANINMLRVWGGGIYEDDIFYELCDKYGIMVWQDFMFAGALYPGDSAFLNNVAEEVRYQVKRLRKHPCIVLWCGNNEIEEAWNNWGWQSQFHYSAADSANVWKDYQTLFHQLIPGILAELDPERPYWSSSPSLGWGRDSAYRKGDVHYWGVWWGKEPVEKYNEKVGRFNSEYGMQGMPDIKTIRQFALSGDMDTASAIMKAHQKHPFGYENIKLYITNRFRQPKNFEDFQFVSQLMQADAIKVAIEAHLRAAPYNMGTLFWQWNDCWPVTSWSAVDYYGRKKALYYEVKRSFASAVFLPHYDSTASHLSFSCHNETTEPVQVRGNFYDFEKGITDSGNAFVSDYKTGNQDKAYLISNLSAEQKAHGVYYFETEQNGKLLNRNYAFAYAPKDLNLPKATLHYELNSNSIEIETDVFAYGVSIDMPDGAELEDNYFHLLPKEKRIVKFSSKLPISSIKKHIKVRSLTDTY